MVYRFEGKDFNSLSEVDREIENRLGAIIDTVPMLGPKERLAVLDMILKNRTQLAALLTVELS